MAIMVVHHGQFMKCQKCGTLYLVSDMVGSATVWHLECEDSLDLVLSVAGYDECTLALVEYVRERGRLEVRPGLGMV